jgi:hypothetical protein
LPYYCVNKMINSNEEIFDLSISNSKRLQILYTLEQQNEILRHLLDVYSLSGVKKLEKFFTSICIHDIYLDLHLKIEIIDTLETVLAHRPISDNSRKCVAHALSNIQFLVALNAFTDSVSWLLFTQWLLRANNHFDQVEVLLRNTVYRAIQEKKPFKQLFSLINHFKDQHFFKALCALVYLKYDQQLHIKERLLLLQIRACGGDRYSLEELFRIAENENIELNLRLEACDIIFLEGSETDKSKVGSIFDSIAPSVEYTNNSENVHIASIQASVERSIDALVDKSKCVIVVVLNEDVLLRRYNEEPEFAKIKGSLHRIFNHTFLKFTKHKLTLRDIIALVCLVIDDCESTLRDELYRRLGQELADMNDTCSRGYVTRLVNVFSGFEIGALGITLSFEDEIYTIFANKVNKLIEDAPDELRDVLLEQLTIPSNEHTHRQELTTYLRPSLPTIWNEIYAAFEDTLTLTDLDLYSRKVMMRYEGLDT